MDLVLDLRYSHMSHDGSGPEISDMITFFCECPEFCQKLKNLTVFRLSCFCVSHFPASVPDVRFRSAMTSSEGLDLGEIMEPLRNSLLSCNSEAKIFTEAISVSECVELLENFGGTALGSGYVTWVYVNFHDKEKIL